MSRYHFAHPPHTIAIFRALQLGDLLCSVPALRALRAGFPDAQITLIGLPWARSFTQRFARYLDDFIEFPGWPGLPEQEARVEAIPEFLSTVQQRHFDLLLQMHGDGTITNPLIALLGARRTAGYAQPGKYQPDSELFAPYPAGEHEVHILLRLVEFLGIPTQGEQLEFPLSGEEQSAFEHFRETNALTPGNYACLHPGARALERRWPVEHFAAVGDRLQAMGLRVIVTGSSAEQALTRAVINNMRAPAIDAGGQTGLGELGGLISQARLLVCNDTGVSHLAAALRTPSVILFRASNPGRWQPLEHKLHRAICNADETAPENVIAEISALLDETGEYASPTL